VGFGFGNIPDGDGEAMTRCVHQNPTDSTHRCQNKVHMAGDVDRDCRIVPKIVVDPLSQ
jgi:hypothetical protein